MKSKIKKIFWHLVICNLFEFWILSFGFYASIAGYQIVAELCSAATFLNL